MRGLRVQAKQMVLAALLVVGVLGPAWAVDSAASFVQNVGDQAVQTLKADVPGPERSSRFRTLLDRSFAMGPISDYALGRQRKNATPEQLATFRGLFEDYLVAVYSSQVGNYEGQVVKVTGSQPQADGSVLVSSQIVSPKDNDSTSLTWRVGSSSAGYRVLDLLVDGTSLLKTQRDQITATIKSSGFDGLFSIMRNRISQK